MQAPYRLNLKNSGYNHESRLVPILSRLVNVTLAIKKVKLIKSRGTGSKPFVGLHLHERAQGFEGPCIHLRPIFVRAQVKMVT